MNRSRHPTWQRLWLLALLLLATWLYTWGLTRNLPYANEADENIFVDRAIVMLSTGDWNPRWFGHPGSTIFYPLLAIYRLWTWWSGGAYPDLPTWFAAEPAPFYYLARLLSVAYTLLAVPLTYQIGRRVFNATTGVVGATLLLTYPTLLLHIKSVRTDGVGLTLALLAIWACLQLYQRPTLGHHLAAGIVIGLGVASRYFLVLFTPLLLWCSWLATSPAVGKEDWRRLVRPWLGALLALGVSFALSTPYFILDFSHAWQGLLTEGRSTHPGADGLSPLQNFFWYFAQIAHSEYGLVQSLFASVGVMAILVQRRALPLSLVGSALLFLAGIAVSPLHWLRWALPIFPIAALISAQGLVTTVDLIIRQQPKVPACYLLGGLLVAAMAVPGLYSLQLSIQDANPNTRLAARLWLLEHLPATAKGLQEPYTSLLIGDPRMNSIGLSLGTDHTLDDYRRDGYTHLVISSYMYDRFLAEPARHPSEAAFYRALQQGSTPLVTFAPTWFRGGPTIQIYALPGQP